MLKIKMAGSVKNCVDSDNSRNLHCVRVSKGTNPWVTATNRILAVAIRSVGESDVVALIPAKVFPSVAEIGEKSADNSSCPEVSMNGAPKAKLTLKGASKRIVDVDIDPEKQRYPKVPSIQPVFEPADVVVVSLNLSMLAAIHEALATSENEACSLFIAMPADGQIVSTVIGIIGANGIGMIMPYVPDRHDESNGTAAEVAKYNEAVSAYKAAF